MSADLEPIDEEYEQNSSDKEYETWLHIPQELVGYVVGKGARNLKQVMSESNTYIRTQNIDDKTYFVIQGDSDDRYTAKLKLKRCASICQSKNEGLSQSWFPCVDGKEGTYELQPCDYQGFQSKLVLKSPIKDYSGRDNYNLLLQELSKILQQNKEKNRSSNIWCHFGKIYINYLQEEREYSLSELESHLMPKRLFAPEETKWRFKFFSGINQSSSKALDNLVSSKPQAYVPYKRKDITFCTPSCRELRLNVFMVVDNEHSSESETVYKNAKCSHEIHNVIKKSGSSPYFYICQSNNRVALVDIFEPSAKVDIRLITESNSESFSEEDVIYKEANLLYEYVKMNLRITEQGEVDLPSENCPPDFEARYNRTSYRDTRVFYSSEEVTITARLSMETHDSANDLDIHLDIEGCSKMTPDEIIDKVPRLLSCARDLAREITISDEKQVQREDVEESGSSDVCIDGAAVDYLTALREVSAHQELQQHQQEQTLSLDELGGSYYFSSAGLELLVPPDAVNEKTNLTVKQLSKDTLSSPARELDGVVSSIIQFEPTNLVFEKPVVATILHYGPTRTAHYVNVAMAFKERTNTWERIQEIEEPSPSTNSTSSFVQVKLTKLTALTVVTRLITDTFVVPVSGCEVRSSVCQEVTLHFPAGGVDKSTKGSLRVVPMPDVMPMDIPNVQFSPIVVVDGFEQTDILKHVLLTLPNPTICPAGHERDLGQVHVLCHEGIEWKDVTETVEYVEKTSTIELQVKHFSKLWVISKVGISVVAFLPAVLCLYDWLKSGPKHVNYLACTFEERVLKILLVLTCDVRQLEAQKTKEEKYTVVARCTGRDDMYPNAKAYIKGQGGFTCDEDKFLTLKEDTPCFEELNFRKKEICDVGSEAKLTIAFYPTKDKKEKPIGELTVYESQLGLPSRTDHSERKIQEKATDKVILNLDKNSTGAICSSSRKHEDNPCTDIIRLPNEMQTLMSMEEATEKAKEFANKYNLDKNSVNDPPDDIRHMCRTFCKETGQIDVVQALRDELPSGMTGPLQFEHDLLVKDMDLKTKDTLSRALTVRKMEWKIFAKEKVNLSADDIDFLDERTKNPVLEILNDHCGDWSVDELYTAIVDCGANAIADRYL